MNHIAKKNRYLQMMYRRCGNSGLLLPEISLGLWHNFGNGDDPEIAKKLILTAFDSGISHFDIANNYGPPPGSAEENFGKIFNQELKHYRDEIIISTKAGYYMWEGPYGEGGSRKYLVSSLDQSLKRLKLDYVDIFYSHRFDPQTDIEETLYTLDSIVRQGKAIYAGISNYPPEQTETAIRFFKELKTPFVIHQVKYSILNRKIEKGLIEVLEKYNKGCIVYSPLAQGLLSNKYLNGIPENSRAAKSTGFLRKDQVTEEVLSKVRKLNDIAESRGQSLAQMAISWILRLNPITSVLLGASSVSQLEENIKSLEKKSFTDEELSTIDEIVN